MPKPYETSRDNQKLRKNGAYFIFFPYNFCFIKRITIILRMLRKSSINMEIILLPHTSKVTNG